MAKDSITDVSKILEKYFNDIVDETDSKTIKMANEGTQKLKNESNTYKIRTGKYNKGWRFKTTKKYGSIECEIYNATNYQLTHLLEEGHEMVTRNGQKKDPVKGYPHITPTATKISKEYEREVETIIRGM